MNSKEEKIADILTKHYCNSNTAKVLVYLFNFDEARSKDIERTMNLRQPEVSIGLKTLKEKNMIYLEPRQKSKGKGRPILMISLSRTKRKVVNIIVKEINYKIEKIEKDIENLKELIKTY